MNKQIFIESLLNRLDGIPEDEKQKSIDYYSEMIDDRMEDGLSEEDAVAAVGSVDNAVNEILENIPLTSIIKTRARTRRKMKPIEIILLIIGSPVWFPLLLCFLVLIFVFYLIIWVIVIVLFAVDLVLLVAGLALLILGIFGMFRAGISYPLAAIGCGLVLMGLALLFFIPIVKFAKVTAKFAKVLARWIKSWFIRRKKDA